MAVEKPSNDNYACQIANLFNGDMRMGKLGEAMRDLIYEHVGGQNIPVASVVGLLEIVKKRLIDTLD